MKRFLYNIGYYFAKCDGEHSLKGCIKFINAVS